MKTATAKKTNTSSSTAKKTPKPKTKRKLAEEIIDGERTKSKGKKQTPIEGVEPLHTSRTKQPNYGERTALARHLKITPQTLYNREFAFVNCLPAYGEGMKLLPRRGGSLKEFPNLTEYQQFCHRQLEEVKRRLSPRDCTPNEILISQNLSLFAVDLFDKQKQLEGQIVPVESETVEVVEVPEN